MDQQLDDIAMELAKWLSNQFVVRHSDHCLALIENNGGRVHPVAWSMIAEVLLRERTNLDSHELARWIATLVRSSQPSCNLFLLAGLVSGLRMPNDFRSALVIYCNGRGRPCGDRGGFS